MSENEQADPADPELADVKMCLDAAPRTLEELELCARLAVRENPDNVAMGLDPVLAPDVILPIKIALVTAKKWRCPRTITVGFMGGNQSQQSFVHAVAPRWLAGTGLRFQFVSGPNADLRVTFNTGQGAWSYIGADNLGIARSQPTMNLGWLDEAVVLHEFGHALGCIHEHQHPEAGIPWDKEKVYRYYGGPPNYWDRNKVDHNLFAKYSRNVTQYSAYDPKSIMHYATDGRLLTDPSKATGWNNNLSASDVQFIKQMYPA